MILSLSLVIIYVIKLKTQQSPQNHIKSFSDFNHYSQYRKYKNVIQFKQNLLKILLKTHQLFLIASLGFLYAHWHAAPLMMKRLPSIIEGKKIEIVGFVSSIPEKRGENWYFDFDITKELSHSLWKKPGRVRLSWYKPDRYIQVGDHYQFFVKLKRPRNFSNPGGFDLEKHYFLNQWVAMGRVLTQEANSYLGKFSTVVSADYYRQILFENIQKALTDCQLQGPLIALILGVKSFIQEEHWKIFQATGTAHLIAISGLHIGFMAGVAFFLMNVIYRLFPTLCLIMPSRRAASIFSILVAFFYAFIAGFSIPTQRAFVMIFIFMMSIFLKRFMCYWHTYFVALWAVLLLSPLATLSGGFWLSFGSVAIILWGMKGRLSINFWYRYGKAQILTFLGLMPLSLLLFGQLSLVSPLANLIAIPWVSFLVVPIALLGTFLLPLHYSLAKFFLGIAETFLKVIWPLLAYLKEWIPMIETANDYPKSVIILAFFGVVIIISPRGFPSRILGFFFYYRFFGIRPIL